MSSRVGPYITTYSGKRFYYLDPRPEDVVIEDVAHVLAGEPRWAGHTDRPYSVGQHSVLTAQLVPVEYRLHALVHDASEVYMRDLPGPLKHTIALAPYQEIEERVQHVIYEAFGLEPLDPETYYEIIKKVDLRLQLTEARDLFTPSRSRDEVNLPEWVEPYENKIRPWGFLITKQNFLQAWKELTGRSDYRVLFPDMVA